MSTNQKKGSKDLDLNLRFQQKYNFDSNRFDEENTNSNKKTKKNNLDNYDKMKEIIRIKNDYKKKYQISFILFITTLLFLFILILVFLILVNQKNNIKTNKKKVNVIPENIVFLGDSITEFYNLSKYYGDDKVNFVNSGINGNSTEDILNDMKNRIYRYNPSKVFLLIGTNDIYYGYEDKKILENIDKIVKGINSYRPYAKIYIESIYPINDTNDEKISHKMIGNRTNYRISNLNKKIKQYCKKEKISYINMNDILTDEDGNLKLEYTKEGLHLSDEGYEIITNKLMNYIK